MLDNSIVGRRKDSSFILKSHERADADDRARQRQETFEAAVTQNYSKSRRALDKMLSSGAIASRQRPDLRSSLSENDARSEIHEPIASVQLATVGGVHKIATTSMASLVLPQDHEHSRGNISPSGPMSIKREPSLTKNMISPIVQRTPHGLTTADHGTVWPDPKQVLQPLPAEATKSGDGVATKPGTPECRNYERLMAQRDAKIGILQKQVDVLKASLREGGLDDAERMLTGLLSTGDTVNNELSQLHAELNAARKQVLQEQENVAIFKEKQVEDMKEVRKMYAEVVQESEVRQEAVMRLEDLVRQKDEALVSWQRSHGELEEELGRTIVQVSQHQNAQNQDQQERSKMVEAFHKSTLDQAKQLDAVRKDRDNLAADLHELKGVLSGHEGLVAQFQERRKNEELAAEKLFRELETTQAEANSLREELVTLQQQTMTHKVWHVISRAPSEFLI